MGKLSIWLDEDAEDSLREYAKKHRISFSAAMARAWLRYLQHQKGESQRWREYLDKIEAKNDLKNLREDGKVIQREIVYGETNLERALDSLMNSNLSKDEKRYWKKRMLKQAVKRRATAKIATRNMRR